MQNMLISEEIRSLAPGHAVYYRLKLPISDGTERVFPSESGGFYKIGESPFGLPSSRYVIYFYDEEYRPIPHGEKTVSIHLPTDLHQQGQLHLPLRTVQGSSARLNLHAQPARTEEQHQPAQGAAALIHPTESQFSGEHDREYRQHLQALDLEERQQEFLKNSTYVTEVAELFTVNRLMRREMLDLHRIIVQHSSRAYQDIDQVKGTIHDLLELQRSVLAHAATQVVKAPGPPPDYVGLGHSALAVVKELGVAILQRSQSRDSERPLVEPRTPPELSAPNAEVTPRPAASSDAVAQLIGKLQGMTEVDLAMAMRAPESWKALLDSLRAPTQRDPAPAAETASVPRHSLA